jgi:hypothetical protein
VFPDSEQALLDGALARLEFLRQIFIGEIAFGPRGIEDVYVFCPVRVIVWYRSKVFTW